MKPGTFQNIYKEMNRKNTILKTPWYGTFKFGFSISTIWWSPSKLWKCRRMNLQQCGFVIFRYEISKINLVQKISQSWMIQHSKIIFSSKKTVKMSELIYNTLTTMITYVALVLGLISGSSSSFSDSSSKSNMASNFIPSNSNSPEDKLYVFVWLI